MKVKEILKDNSIWIPNQHQRPVRPVVSIICPTYSRGKNGLFSRAVESALRQHFENFELIIVDDCSTDGSFELTKQFMKQDDRVHCIRHTYNVGLPAVSLYEGYMKTRGEYVAFLFDDNEWEADYLLKTIPYMIQKKIKASYGVYRLHELNGNIWMFGDDPATISRLSCTNRIGNGAVVLHREVLEYVGLYDPHLSLTRLCDWDLWRRVSRKYLLMATHVLAGDEWGATQSDSLRNSLKMDQWCAFERMNLDRNEMLRPENFLECDIGYIPPRSTQLFRDYMNIFWSQYEKKSWYRRPDEPLAAKGSVKYIAVIVQELNASSYLTFERLDQNPEFIVRTFLPNMFPWSELICADAVIIVRMLYGLEPYERMCAAFNIPLYYYVDDNYLELQNDFENDHAISLNAQKTTAVELVRYDGIFLSSALLARYFEKKYLHRKLMVLNPVMGNILRDPTNDQTEHPFTVVFMGGIFREETFYTTVVPALLRLSVERPVRVITPTPEKKCFQVSEQVIKQLQWEYLPRNLSLELYLHQINSYYVDVVAHCGPVLENNCYKTENMLMNATQIGAVLVSSKNGQLFSAPIKNSAAFSVENEPDEWYSCLSQLANSNLLRRSIWEKARKYCEKEYSKSDAVCVIKQMLGEIKPMQYVSLLSRYKELYFDLFYHMNKFATAQNAASEKPSRDRFSAPLVLSQLIMSGISYRIHCDISVWSEIGVCFGCYGNLSGTVKLTIQKDGNDMRVVEKRLEEIDIAQWNYFSFEPIVQTGSTVYTINFEFDYEKNSSLVGIFEDSRNRTFLYKVFNKLGHHLPGLDALYADCR